MRRRAVVLAVAALLLCGCGAPSGDLFEVKRSGADPAANLDMVVSDGGDVTCNGRSHALPAKQLLAARELTRELGHQAELNLQLPAGPNAVLSYRVRTEKGTVAFSDTSHDLPLVFQKLAAFTKDVSEDVCGIQR